MLDMRQAGEVIAQLQQADAPDRPIDPALPMRLEQARRQVEAAFAEMAQQQSGFSAIPGSDLVGAGLSLVARWLRS
jgi:hypothetical protein